VFLQLAYLEALTGARYSSRRSRSNVVARFQYTTLSLRRRVAPGISEVPSRGSPRTTDILINHNWCFPSRFHLFTCRAYYCCPAAAELKRLEGLVVSPLGMRLRDHPPEPTINLGLLRRSVGLDIKRRCGGLGRAAATWP
jgi:hypothetical protein